jgi:drug/metabolite transporter (DMT)-like permease
MPAQGRPDQLTLAAFLLLVVLAGGNAVGIDVAADELDPFWAAASRFALAGLIFAVLMAVLRVPVPRGGALAGALLYGVIGFGAAFGIAFVAIPMTGAGAGQLLLGLVPLLTLLLAPLHGLEPFRLRAIAGSLIALGGVAILTLDRISLDVPLEGIGLAFLGALCLAEAGVVVKLTPRSHPVATNAVAMLTGAAMLTVISLLAGDRWALPTQLDTWLAMGYLVLAGSVAVFWLFVFVLGRWTASGASFEFLLIPLATIPSSALITHEMVTPVMLLGGALILAGVYLGVLAPATLRPPMADEPATR